MVVKKRLACHFQKCVGDLWLGEDYHDFTVLVEDKSFQCHRFILSACSEFFSALLRTDMKENLENCTKLGGMTPDTFNTIITAIYKGEYGLTTDNIIDIWHASNQLQIMYLITECENYVLKILSNENYFRFYQHAKLLNSVRVSQEVDKFMLNNFETFRKTSTFLDLSVDDLYRLVRSHDLNVTSEDLVLESVLVWVKHIPEDSRDNCCVNQSDVKSTELAISSTKITVTENEATPAEQVKSCTKRPEATVNGRLQHLKMLITGVRLHLVNLTVLQNLLKEDTFVLAMDAYGVVVESFIYHSQVENRHVSWPEAAIHRDSSSMDHVMVYCFNNQLKAYSLKNNTIRVISSVRYLKNMCVFDNVIYMSHMYEKYQESQGYYSYDRLTMYSRSGNLSNLIDHSISMTRADHLLIQGKYIYCLNTSGQVHRFRPESGYEIVWRPRPKVDISVGISSAVTFEKYILCFGESSSQILCYDPESDKSWDMSRLEGPMNNIVGFSDSKHTYLLQRNGVLTKIQTTEPFRENFLFVSQLWSDDWELYGAILFRGQLFVFGKTPQANAILDSLPGVFDSVRLVSVDSSTKCLPMVLPKSGSK